MASPSGILCKVMEKTSMAQRLNPADRPFFPAASRFWLKWVNARSPQNSRKPPPIKPISAVLQGHIPSSSAMSIEGESRDQNEAATITPPASPSMASITFRLGLRKRKTTQAPKLVKAQVISVAHKACTGPAS